MVSAPSSKRISQVTWAMHAVDIFQHGDGWGGLHVGRLELDQNFVHTVETTLELERVLLGRRVERDQRTGASK